MYVSIPIPNSKFHNLTTSINFDTLSAYSISYNAMNIGYARISTADQTLNLQQDALEKAGCAKIFTDTASGAKSERKGLEEVLSHMREGDVLVVWRLDRLGRSLRDL